MTDSNQTAQNTATYPGMDTPEQTAKRVLAFQLHAEACLLMPQIENPDNDMIAVGVLGLLMQGATPERKDAGIYMIRKLNGTNCYPSKTLGAFCTFMYDFSTLTGQPELMGERLNDEGKTVQTWVHGRQVVDVTLEAGYFPGMTWQPEMAESAYYF
jgi:hypothetical protein